MNALCNVHVTRIPPNHCISSLHTNVHHLHSLKSMPTTFHMYNCRAMAKAVILSFGNPHRYPFASGLRLAILTDVLLKDTAAAGLKV